MSKQMIKALRGLMIFAAVLVLAVTHLDKVFTGAGFVVGIFKPFTLMHTNITTTSIPVITLTTFLYIFKISYPFKNYFVIFI